MLDQDRTMRLNEWRVRGSLHRPLEESMPQFLIEKKAKNILMATFGSLVRVFIRYLALLMVSPV